MKRIKLAALMVVIGLNGAVEGSTDGRWPAKGPKPPNAILINPFHHAQVVRADDGMDHVEYNLLVVSVLNEPLTLSSLTVISPTRRALQRIDGNALAAATQTLFDHKPSPEIPASAARSVDVDLILPPGTAPARITHRIAYTLEPDTQSAVFIGVPEVDGPDVTIDRRPPIVIKPPLEGEGWLVASGCCKPNLHRDTRFAVDDGRHLETPELFFIDWNQIRGEKIFDGDGSKNEQHYAYGADVLAVADGTVVSVQDGKPDQTPNELMVPRDFSDFGGNHVMLEIAPNVFAIYFHLQQGSITVNAGNVVKAGARIARIGNSGPSAGPHLHFGLADKPDGTAGRSLPFVFDSYTVVGSADEASTADHIVITPDWRQVRDVYPLLNRVLNFPKHTH